MKKLKLIFFLGIILGILYIVWGGAFTHPIILTLRLKKVLIFILVSLSSAFGTIAFQAVVTNRYLTPGILGIESYYRLIQTLLLFFGYQFISVSFHPAYQFLLVVALMVLSYLLFSKLSFQNLRLDLHTVLMMGLVISMLFQSLSTFFQVLMDPNEYAQLQSRLFPTFQNVDNSVLLLAAVLMLPIIISLWRKRNILEVLEMGNDHAINLGIDTNKEVKRILMQVIVLSAVSSALVGPMMFLGFTTANLTYLVFKTYRMNLLLLGASVIGFMALIIGQFLVERIFAFQTSASILIEWLGGILFFVLLWKERKHK